MRITMRVEAERVAGGVCWSASCAEFNYVAAAGSLAELRELVEEGVQFIAEVEGADIDGYDEVLVSAEWLCN